MHIRYPRIYRALKQLGLSPAKAIECMIDAKRHEPIALAFIRIAKHQRS